MLNFSKTKQVCSSLFWQLIYVHIRVLKHTKRVVQACCASVLCKRVVQAFCASVLCKRVVSVISPSASKSCGGSHFTEMQRNHVMPQQLSNHPFLLHGSANN